MQGTGRGGVQQFLLGSHRVDIVGQSLVGCGVGEHSGAHVVP